MLFSPFLRFTALIMACVFAVASPHEGVAQSKPAIVTQTPAPSAESTAPAASSAERERVVAQCNRSVLSRVYYDCTCIGDAFDVRFAQATDGQTPEQILTEIYEGAPACVNRSGIVAFFTNPQLTCMQMRTVMDGQTIEEATTGCQCAGQHVADAFALNPRLRTRLIEDMTVNAFVACNSVR